MPWFLFLSSLSGFLLFFMLSNSELHHSHCSPGGRQLGAFLFAAVFAAEPVGKLFLTLQTPFFLWGGGR